MEKIHSAIQKARKERDAKLSGAATSPAPEAVAATPATLPEAAAPRAAMPEAASPEAAVPEAAAPEAPVVLPAPPPATTEAEVAALWAGLHRYHPDRRTLKRNHIVAFDSGTESASYDVLRTNILRQMRTNGWKRLAITSPTPDCGKTTTCLNLGFSLGRLHDLRTLVIETDLRRPSMRHALHLRQKHDFAAVLSGAAPAEAHVVAHGAGLAFGTNADPLKNSAELLASSRVTDSLAEIDRRLAPDICIFDMPPMLVGDDTLAFLPQVDCVLMVAAAGVTTTTQIDRCERALAEQSNVLGVVLNKCQFMAPDEYYGYDYY